MISPVHPIRRTSFILIILCIVPLRLNAQASGNDRAYMVLGPRKEIKHKKIKKDQSIQAFTREGVILGKEAAGPWYNATCFAHGSVTMDLEGKVLKEVMIVEATDADGDISWAVLWFPERSNMSTRTGA